MVRNNRRATLKAGSVGDRYEGLAHVIENSAAPSVRSSAPERKRKCDPLVRLHKSRIFQIPARNYAVLSPLATGMVPTSGVMFLSPTSSVWPVMSSHKHRCQQVAFQDVRRTLHRVRTIARDSQLSGMLSSWA